LVGKSKAKRPLRRSRRRWEENIEMDVREIGWAGLILAQDRDQGRALINMVMNFRVS
jgi:hypothetical protein